MEKLVLTYGGDEESEASTLCFEYESGDAFLVDMYAELGEFIRKEQAYCKAYKEYEDKLNKFVSSHDKPHSGPKLEKYNEECDAIYKLRPAYLNSQIKVGGFEFYVYDFLIRENIHSLKINIQQQEFQVETLDEWFENNKITQKY